MMRDRLPRMSDFDQQALVTFDELMVDVLRLNGSRDQCHRAMRTYPLQQIWNIAGVHGSSSYS